MMVKAVGSVWHKKQKEEGVIPKGLRGLDKEARWGKSNTDGWVYGHGTFSIVSHKVPVLGVFRWMPNSGHEGKLLELEIVSFTGFVKKVCMNSKADDEPMYRSLKEDCQMQLLRTSRKGMDKSQARQQMIKEISTDRNRKIYKQRGVTVEPMQGVVKEIFELESCWMRGDANNRWLFAAMCIAVQMAQEKAYASGKSTWRIKEEALGL
jgi:hypothetical protein